jgi:hypothetical protein
VLSDATYQSLTTPPDNCEPMGEQLVKGRQTPVFAYVIDCSQLNSENLACADERAGASTRGGDNP